MITQGTLVKHGSPGYETEEVVKKVVELFDGSYEIVFESGAFTRMDGDTFDDLVTGGKVQYLRQFEDLPGQRAHESFFVI